MPRLTGARPSPKHKAFSVPSHVASKAIPSSFGIVPAQLSYWGNQDFGNCVSAEEAAGKAIYSLMGGGTAELFITEAEVIAWARAHGFLNGTNLTDVMDQMAKQGMTANGTTYGDGPYVTVDWTTDATLRSAIYQGPVKIGVAAAQLQNTVGTTNGWFATGFKQDQDEDHCINLCGYGTLAECFAMLALPLPFGANPSAIGYLSFCWDTIGVFDQPSLIAICGEAWLRTPTTPSPVPGPTPAPTPTPIPPAPTPTPVPPTPGPTPVPVVGGNFTISGNVTLTPIVGH